MFSASGGLIYHWRALRFRNNLWLRYVIQTRQMIQAWLEKIPLDQSELVLVGPSGGYSLPLEALGRFNLKVIDPDPLAHRILNFRLWGRFTNRPQDQHISEDFILSRKKRFLDSFPGAAILFCNIWGQVGILSKDPEDLLGFWREVLPEVLEDRYWMSYHDRFSTEQMERPVRWTLDGSASIRTQVGEFFKTATGEVEDHLTEALFPLSEKKGNLLWEIEPSRFHGIEFLTSPSLISEKSS